MKNLLLCLIFLVIVCPELSLGKIYTRCQYELMSAEEKLALLPGDEILVEGTLENPIETLVVQERLTPSQRVERRLEEYARRHGLSVPGWWVSRNPRNLPD